MNYLAVGFHIPLGGLGLSFVALFLGASFVHGENMRFFFFPKYIHRLWNVVVSYFVLKSRLAAAGL